MLRLLVLATLLGVAVGIAPSRLAYLAVKGNVTCSGKPDPRANVSILYRVDDVYLCPGQGLCFAKVASRHVDSRGRFELREHVTLSSSVQPVFQLKADYGCANDNDDKSAEQPIEPPVWTHNFNYNS